MLHGPIEHVARTAQPPAAPASDRRTAVNGDSEHGSSSAERAALPPGTARHGLIRVLAEFTADCAKRRVEPSLYYSRNSGRAMYATVSWSVWRSVGGVQSDVAVLQRMATGSAMETDSAAAEAETCNRSALAQLKSKFSLVFLSRQSHRLPLRAQCRARVRAQLLCVCAVAG